MLERGSPCLRDTILPTLLALISPRVRRYVHLRTPVLLLMRLTLCLLITLLLLLILVAPVAVVLVLLAVRVLVAARCCCGGSMARCVVWRRPCA